MNSLSAALVLCLALAPPLLAAETLVDLELVLAVDVSSSMDMAELELQRAGYVAAITDPAVIAAIEYGPTGRIALSYVEWAGPSYQILTMPWQIIDGAASARRFADQLAAQPILRQTDTSISAALLFSAAQFASNGFYADRQVIDISGDGPNTAGPHIVPTRDAVVEQGIVINGLPLILAPAPIDPNSAITLADYYRDCVIGGPAAFLLPVQAHSGIVVGIRRKLILEVAMAQMPLAPVAANAAVQTDCTLGQKDFYE